jgi:succinate dehydrogenase flavin-adding protein (antitoxin of CptAB toxin-antitoxin module)
MATSGDLEYLQRRAKWLGKRSLLELEVILMETMELELPVRIQEEDYQWLSDLVEILELDDYILMDAILGNSELPIEYETDVLDVLQSHLPGARMMR